ncbi:hypothetical protein HY745_07730 [Candidatus Desantisbacteria bacterium]|nr:hypothetical protein [Candidatus Desantisbacteria bacterium]
MNIHQEDIDTHLLVKLIDVNTAKISDILDVKTDFFKIFSISDCKNLLVYHPNNGNDKGIDLNLIHIFNMKEKKDFTFFKKKKSFPENSIIDQIVWAYNSNELLYIEANGKYNQRSGEFEFESEPILKKIIIKKPELPVTVFPSPEGYNIIEIWHNYEKGVFCQLYDKNKEKFKLALIDFNGP